METLSHKDLLALNRAIGEIYTARDMESFYRSVFSSIQPIIPGELFSFNEISAHSTGVINATTNSQEHRNISNKLFPAFKAHFHEHPFVPHRFSLNVLKSTDFASKSHFKIAALYHLYYKHLDIETQMSATFPVSNKKLLALTLSRKSPDFSERDRLLLTLMKPHMINALRNATELGGIKLERDLLQKGAEAERQGAVLFQSDGMVLCLSPLAKALLSKYFGAILGEGDMLPVRLLNWFKTGNPSKRVERPVLTIEKENRGLTIKLLNDFTTGDYILLLTETDPSGTMRNLQGYGLSCRETEVLLLLSKGKTNREIAMILGMSRRTAEKHMENIFAKLGVETRAAAAAVVRR